MASCGLQLAVRRLALDLDLLFAQGDGLLDRPLVDARGDPHPAAQNLALADRDVLLDLGHARLVVQLGAWFVRIALIALHDRSGFFRLAGRSTGGNHGLAAAYRLGVAASIILAEATLDDFGHDLVLVACQDLDILILEAGFDQLVDELLSDLGALDGGDDGCC